MIYNPAASANNRVFQPIPVMPAQPILAHAYVPFQYYKSLYSPMKALERGTIFPDLDRPYGMDPEYTIDE